MRKLIVLAAVLGVLAGLDVAAKSIAESQIEKKAKVEAGASARASASIKSFPFVGRLLVSGTAGDITLSMHDVSGQSLRFSTVAITLADVHLDKARMFKGKAEITSIRKGTITIGLSAQDVQNAIRLPVTMSDNKITVSVSGRAVVVTPSATGEGSVRLSANGLPVTVNVPIPQTRRVSCKVSRVEVRGGELRASCDINEIPPALLRAASRVVSR